MSTRPKISWSDLFGAKVGIWGLGVEGMANLKRLVSQDCEIVLVDDHPASDEVAGWKVLATGRGGQEALERCDVVVKAPGISRYRPEVKRLVDHDVPVVGGLGLWIETVDRTRVACVTGTKGKSTTVTIAGHLLERWGYDVLVGGNVGTPPYEPVNDRPHDLWIIETSSFQATDLASGPRVVGVTALHPDHLDWHGTVETYYRDKLSLCRLPGVERVVASATSKPLRDNADLLGDQFAWVASHGGASEAWIDALDLPGRHNRQNALIAQACLQALGVKEAADLDALLEAAPDMPDLESRLHIIEQLSGVAFVDDSLSTNVLPTLAALDTFTDRRVALIVGGHDRGIDYGALGQRLAQRDQPTLVLTLPENGPRIHQAINAHAVHTSAPLLEVVDLPSLDLAVADGYRFALPDGVVLLSPAAPSFGQFRDYRERGEAFRTAVARLALHDRQG